MEYTIKEVKKVNVQYLKVSAGVRYWEDATVNGIEDEDGKLIPFRVNDYWQPLIHIDTGTIVDWPEGVTANINYKVCDDGIYKLLDQDNNIIKSVDGYVPSLLSPEENGYGDYIIMNVDANGVIRNWKPNLKDFNEED